MIINIIINLYGVTYYDKDFGINKTIVLLSVL